MSVRRRSNAAVAALSLGPALAAAILTTGCGGRQPWLVDIAPEAGLDFVYEIGDAGGFYFPQLSAAGVGLFDFDGDGDLDVYFANGNRRLPLFEADPTSSDRLFRREADGRYIDVTAASGLGDTYFSMGVATGDYDNDGDQDVFVSNLGPDQLYKNRGDGTFENATVSSRIDIASWSAGAVFTDVDRDGFLDLFVGQYVEYDRGKRCATATGVPDWCGPSSYRDLPDILLHNNGDGTFTDISAKAGIGGALGASLGVIADDFDADGWPDILVANDGDPNTLWHNNGNGTFVDAAVRWGAAVSALGEPEAGMGIVSDDLNADGTIDLLITHLVNEKTTFYRSLGAGAGFIDDSFAAGIGGPSRMLTGWGIAATDLELDGDLDIVVANGRVKRGQGVLPGAVPPPPLDELSEPKLAYLNDGSGHFTVLDPVLCGGCGLIESSRGLVPGDVDGDGDQDLLILNLGSPARLLENRAPRAGKWLAVRATDPALHRAALGARVTVRAAGRAQARTVRSSMGYASAQEPVAHFGLGDVAAVEAVEVRWPSGEAETFTASCVDCAIEVRRGEGMAVR
ncbi:MAG: CRTAC1 family protein [Ardenticatenales bacterium]|nr:CRTAC1 family protein [Ardenticatenales bacterium]